MSLMFNTLLEKAGLKLEDVRLVRHKDNRATRGFTPYDLWCNEQTRPQFEPYQSCQNFRNRKILNAPYWAVFLGTPSDETLFVGLYGVNCTGPLDHDQEVPIRKGGMDKAGSVDAYRLTLLPTLGEFIGKLIIDWGPGALAYVQYAHKNDKPVTELRPEFKERRFPGALDFTSRLSEPNGLPMSWVSILEEYRGIYLLTCPKTGLQYVGKADGKKRFWGRWQDYVKTGDGGNEGLKRHHERHHERHHQRERRSDYQVSILEVAGTAATDTDISQMERRWMAKLHTRERGLNE